ncbi:hypothetical protein Tco_0545580 [Tanacetum coccineum]
MIRKKPTEAENADKDTRVGTSQVDMMPQISVRDPVVHTIIKGRLRDAARVKHPLELPAVAPAVSVCCICLFMIVIVKHHVLIGYDRFRAKVTLKRMGIWLCGVCFKTYTLRANCRHGADFVSPPDIGDGFVCFVLYDLTKPLVPSCSQLDLIDGLLHDQHDGFTLSLLDSLFSKGLRTVKSIPPKFRLGFLRVLRVALDKVICKPDDVACWVSLLVLPLCLLKTFNPGSNLECKSANKRRHQEECIANAIRSWGVPGGSLQLVRETLAESGPHMLDLDGEDIDLTERNLKQCKRKICDGHYTTAVRVLSSSGVAPYNDATLQELKTKHPFMSTPSLRDSHIDHHPLIASQDVVLDRIKSFPRGNCPTVLGGYIASALLTPLVKPGGGIRPIDVGTIWRRLVSKVSATMIGYSLDGLQFGVGVLGGGEAILHAVNHLVEDRGDDVGLSMLFVDFQNSFNLSSATLALPDCTTESTPCGHAKGCSRAWYLDDGTIVRDTLVVGKVLELITEDGPRNGLHLNVDKTELFWPKEDPRSRLEGIFPHNISRPLHGVKLLGGPVSVDVDFGSALVMKRVSKTIGLLDAVAKINDPQCELLLIRACAGVSKLYFTMRTCPPHVFESAQLSFDMALRSALERIVMTSGSGFGDWQWRLATLPFAFGGLGIYSAGDVLNYAFIASRLQSATLQTKLLRDVGIVAPGSTFDDALCVFNNAMEIDFLSNPSEVAAPKLMKKMADIYFTRVTKDAESSYSLSPRQMALWQSQKEDHTLDWLCVVPISGLGQTMNGKTYRSVLCYRLGVPLFSVSKPCSACSRVFIKDIYGDHAISCDGIIRIKHRHNMVCDTLVNICFRSGISAGKEVDIGLDGGHDKKLRPANMLLYSWDGGLDVYVYLTGSSPLTQTGMSDFAPGRAVTDAAQRKRGKYMTKCADIGYGFLPFSFSSFGELEKDAVTLLKRVRNFSMAQDIRARAASHIFNRMGFSISISASLQCICAAIGYEFLQFSFSSLRELEADVVTLLKRIWKFSTTQNIGARAAVHIFNRIGFAIAKGKDPRSRLAVVFSPNIARPLHGAKLLGGLASVGFNFSSELVMKRVAKTIVLMDTISNINDPQCELLLLRACVGIPELYLLCAHVLQCSFNATLRSALERVITASGPGFGDWQWRLATLPFAFGGLGVYCAGDVLNYAFLASRLQSASLIHFSLSSRHMALWQSQIEDHTSDWLWVVLISGLGQTMNGGIYGDHDVSCASIIDIKHRQNVVRDTLVDICFQSGISVGKEVDIGLGSSPLTHTGMVDFVPDHAVIDAAYRKRVKYEAKCAKIGYGFLPFSYSLLGELEKDALTTVKRIRKFFMTQDIGARVVVHIFDRISFAIAKGVGAQLVSQLPTNFL